MAQPRLRCLNATRHVVNIYKGKVAFSSSSMARADDTPPIRRSQANNLLATIQTVSPPSKVPFTPATASPNPEGFKLPGGSGTKQNTLPSLSSTLRVARLANLRSGQNSKPPRNVTPEDLEKHGRSQDITRQISRRWKAGDVYAPKDLSDVEMAKWKKRSKPERDVFDVLGFDPVANYKNFSVMSEYMTPMGRIKHGKETGLRSVNQRKIAKAIRRVIGLGMMPSVHRHPELLHKSAARSDPTTASRKLY